MQTATGTHITAPERDNLCLFRQVAVEARRAAAMQRDTGAAFRVVNGYIESDAEMDRYRALSVPVRRTSRASDPVAVTRILEVLRRSTRSAIQTALVTFDERFSPLRDELASVSILNDQRVVHAELFAAWLDAMVFPEVAEKVRPYQAMVREYGKSVEGLSLFVAERWLDCIIALDDIVADFLEEPRWDGREDDGARDAGR